MSKTGPQYEPFIGDGRGFAYPSQRTRDNLPDKQLPKVSLSHANKLVDTFTVVGTYGSWTGGKFWIIVEYCLANNVKFKLFRATGAHERWIIEREGCMLPLSNPEDWKEIEWK